MAVRCSKCGEELLGPVNRCWKCGQTFATLPDAGGLPPVRHEPAASTSVVIAERAPASLPASEAGDEPPVAAQPVDTIATPRIRTGSPFAAGSAVKMVSPAVRPSLPNRPKPPATAQLIRDQVAVAGAIGSLVLGGFAVAVSWMQNPTAVIGGALIAVFGMAMGIWGLHSKRRGWALFGLLICVVAIALATYSGAMILYQMQLEAKELEGLIE